MHHGSELAQQTQLVGDRPTAADLSVLEGEQIQRPELELATGRLDRAERAGVRAGVLARRTKAKARTLSVWCTCRSSVLCSLNAPAVRTANSTRSDSGMVTPFNVRGSV